MASEAIASFSPVSAVNPLKTDNVFDLGAQAINSATAATAPTADQVNSPGFAAVLDQIGGVEQAANTAAVDLAAGRLDNPHEFTALAAQARLTVELTAAVRNRGIEAFNEVMRMQV